MITPDQHALILGKAIAGALRGGMSGQVAGQHAADAMATAIKRLAEEPSAYNALLAEVAQLRRENGELRAENERNRQSVSDTAQSVKCAALECVTHREACKDKDRQIAELTATLDGVRAAQGKPIGRVECKHPMTSGTFRPDGSTIERCLRCFAITGGLPSPTNDDCQQEPRAEAQAAGDDGLRHDAGPAGARADAAPQEPSPLEAPAGIAVGTGDEGAGAAAAPPSSRRWARRNTEATYHLFATGAVQAHCEEPLPTIGVMLDPALVAPACERLCLGCLTATGPEVEAARELFAGIPGTMPVPTADTEDPGAQLGQSLSSVVEAAQASVQVVALPVKPRKPRGPQDKTCHGPDCTEEGKRDPRVKGRFCKTHLELAEQDSDPGARLRLWASLRAESKKTKSAPAAQTSEAANG